MLPSRDFHGLWESLVFDTDVKTRLTKYAGNALLFSERGVNPNLIAWNRVVLLHGRASHSFVFSLNLIHLSQNPLKSSHFITQRCSR